MIIKKALLLIAIWCSFTIESLSSQERISGSNLVDLVIQKLNIKSLIVGEDFKFGYNQTGDIKQLKYFADSVYQ